MNTVKIICAVFLVSLFSCFNRNSVSFELRQIEYLMETAPDSSLAILKKIEHPENLSKKEYATYCLLLTQAEDKNYIQHTTDSLIKIATDYFERHEDKNYTLLSYYYMGRVYSEMQEALQAQKYYLKALVQSDDSGNPLLKGLICNHLGTLYMYQDIFEMALPMYQKAFDLMEQTKDSTRISFVLRNTARLFKETNKPDSAIFYYQKAISYSTDKSVSSIYNDLSNLYLDNNNSQEAYTYIRKAINLTTDSLHLAPAYLTLGAYFVKTEKYDSASMYLNKSLESPILYTKAGSLFYLKEIAKSKKNYKDYFNYSELYDSLKDSIEEDSHFENIRFVQSMFNYQRIEDEKTKFKEEASSRMLIIHQILIFFAVLTIIAIFIIKNEQQKKRTLLELKERLYKQSQQYVEDNIRKIQLLEEEIFSGKEVLSDTEKQLFEARKLMLEMENRQVLFKKGTLSVMEKDFKSSQIYMNVHKAEDILTESEWSELSQLVDATYSDFTQRLVKIYARISTEELRVCYLVKMEVPVKKIAILMGRTNSGITQCRKRLYKKLTDEAENSEKLDLFIFDF